MGRHPNPVDAPEQALADLAAGLRQLRIRAANPPYRKLAARARYSASTLSEAASGRRLPSKAVVVAYAAACGADPDEWGNRWEGVAAAFHEQRERQSTASPAKASEPGSGAEPQPTAGFLEAAAAATDRRLGPRSPTRTAAVVAAVVLAAGGVLTAAHSGWGPPVSARSGSPAPSRPITLNDGQDPYIHGCGPDQQVLERRPVFWPDGAQYGELVLYYSPHCDAGWGYVYGPNSPRWEVFIRAHRIEDDKVAESSFSGTARPNSWGNALSARHGCVRAEAWVVTKNTGATSKLAMTSCFSPGDQAGSPTAR